MNIGTVMRSLCQFCLSTLWEAV